MPQTLSGSRSASVEIYLILLFLPYKKDGFLAQGLQRAVPGKPVRKLWQGGVSRERATAFTSNRTFQQHADLKETPSRVEDWDMADLQSDLPPFPPDPSAPVPGSTTPSVALPPPAETTAAQNLPLADPPKRGGGVVFLNLFPYKTEPRRWNIFIFILELCCFAPAIYWVPYSHLPAPGWSVALIAVAAALMTIHDRMTGPQRFGWLILMAFFLAIELRSISKDRWDSQQIQLADRKAERQSFSDLLTQEDSNSKDVLRFAAQRFGEVIKQQQQDFSQTMQRVEIAQSAENKNFAGVLNRQEQAFERQHELSEQFRGRLVPGDAHTPENACHHQPKPGEVIVISGDSASVTTAFPHTILEVGGFPVLSVDRINDSDDLSLSVDVRDNQNRIIFRIDKNGAVNRSPSAILLQPDKSTFIVQNDHGQEVFSARFINPQTFEVRGTLAYCGRSFPVQNPAIHEYCATNDVVDVEYPASPCPNPTQP